MLVDVPRDKSRVKPLRALLLRIGGAKRLRDKASDNGLHVRSWTALGSGGLAEQDQRVALHRIRRGDLLEAALRLIEHGGLLDRESAGRECAEKCIPHRCLRRVKNHRSLGRGFRDPGQLTESGRQQRLVFRESFSLRGANDRLGCRVCDPV